jgi:hypothetical protein
MTKLRVRPGKEVGLRRKSRKSVTHLALRSFIGTCYVNFAWLLEIELAPGLMYERE